ncbi:unnamed protein product [Brassica oleracea]
MNRLAQRQFLFSSLGDEDTLASVTNSRKKGKSKSSTSRSSVSVTRKKRSLQS